MKKIFLVLFLILTISIPAFAKKQKAEPDWMHFMTAQDGTEWFYDVNSLKNKFGMRAAFNINIKNIKDGISNTEKYMISCPGRKNWELGANNPFGIEPYIIQVKNSKIVYYKEGHLSGYLITEFCKGKYY